MRTRPSRPRAGLPTRYRRRGGEGRVRAEKVPAKCVVHRSASDPGSQPGRRKRSEAEIEAQHKRRLQLQPTSPLRKRGPNSAATRWHHHDQRAKHVALAKARAQFRCNTLAPPRLARQAHRPYESEGPIPLQHAGITATSAPSTSPLRKRGPNSAASRWRHRDYRAKHIALAKARAQFHCDTPAPPRLAPQTRKEVSAPTSSRAIALCLDFLSRFEK